MVAGVPPARTKLADLTGRVDGLTGRVDHMSEEIRELRTGLARMGERIENILTGQMGQDLRDLKSRMLVVEEKLMARAHEPPAPPYGGEPKK